METTKFRIDPLTGEHFRPRRSDQKYATPENQKKAGTIRSNETKRKYAEKDKAKREANKAGLKILGEENSKIVSAEFARGCGINLKKSDLFSNCPRPIILYDVSYIYMSEENVIVRRLKNSAEDEEPDEGNQFGKQNTMLGHCSMRDYHTQH